VKKILITPRKKIWNFDFEIMIHCTIEKPNKPISYIVLLQYDLKPSLQITMMLGLLIKLYLKKILLTLF